MTTFQLADIEKFMVAILKGAELFEMHWKQKNADATKKRLSCFTFVMKLNSEVEKLNSEIEQPQRHVLVIGGTPFVMNPTQGEELIKLMTFRTLHFLSLLSPTDLNRVFRLPRKKDSHYNDLVYVRKKIVESHSKCVDFVGDSIEKLKNEDPRTFALIHDYSAIFIDEIKSPLKKKKVE